MIQVESFTLGYVMTNCYLLYRKQGGEGIVIDPGTEPDALLKRIAELQLSVKEILLTHAHFDHIGGVEAVREATGASVTIHQAETEWLTDSRLNGSGMFPGIPEISCQPADKVLHGGETISVLGEKVKVAHTPGHSPGSLSFIFPQMVFSGDVLFAGSIGRTDLPGGDHQTLMRSIHDTIMELPEETIVYSGHGPVTTIGREQESNPFVTGMIG
ncbi:Glyoxylase, beta-lactamase superfamily II [Marininema mesophilum]|uniref:Glyoxylase, beta-lactamase superfamily II n=1 Tax=Marininema mesophilum TaxID=1048340 RepID=A0A1H2QKJ3_9BACL|nr:MBL fold metallo-hydrolase [Marininema mesophilum]SDW06929.1 Glyoxylase, beta-lactamase superfamily II [Marininema mesophilum]